MITTLSVSEFFPEVKGDKKELLAQMSEMVQKYPASLPVVLTYLKLLQELDVKRYDKEKKLWLLSIFNKSYFIKTTLQIHENLEEEKEQEESANIDGLIETFYQNPPKMRFDPEKHSSTENFAKSSLLEDDELISETLAMIYAEQGFTGKAEKMLKKLSLHFPEKSCYFAALIEKVKNKESNT